MEEQDDDSVFFNERREESTSVSEVARVLANLKHIWDGWMKGLGKYSEDHFEKEVLDVMWDDETTSGENQIKELKQVEEDPDFVPGEPCTPEGRAAKIRISTLMVSCAYCIQSFREEANSAIAWSYVADANQWLGLLQGICTDIGGNSRKAASDLGRKGADAAHAENRAMKAQVMEWCDKHMAQHRSMDAAAESIAGKVVPVKFRTAREWIGEWKKLRSGGKP